MKSRDEIFCGKEHIPEGCLEGICYAGHKPQKSNKGGMKNGMGSG